MDDKHDIQILPNHDESSIVLSEARSSLVSRGRKDALGLVVAKAGPKLIARVRFCRRHFHLESGNFIPAIHNWGLIDRTGKFIVEPNPNYFRIESFSGGLAAFSVSPILYGDSTDFREQLFNSDRGLWGYLDPTGRVAIAPRYECARPFRDDLAGVKINGKWGFVYKDGTFAIGPRFDSVRDFNGGVAIAKLGSKCGFIDYSGAFVIEPQFSLLWEFSEGLALAEIGGKYGYINRHNIFAIAPQFDSLVPYYSRSFRHGVAVAVDADGTECVINKSGDVIFKCAEVGESIGEFTDGIARVFEVGGYHDYAYFIDRSGQPLLKDIEEDEDKGCASACDAAGDFSEGLGLIAGSYKYMNDGTLWQLVRYADRQGSIRLYGYIDTQGNMIIHPRLHSARPFKNGLAATDPDGNKKYGFIDPTGKMIIEPGFAEADDFENGMAKVKGKGGKWGFIDKSGDLVIPYQYDRRDAYAYNFEEITT